MKTAADFIRQLDILDALEQIELALSRMYLACSQKFAPDSRIWLELHQEELKHADMIEQLKELIKANPDRCSAGKFNPESIITFTKGIEAQMENLSAGKIDREKALILARDYENSLLEKNFFDTITSTLPEFLNLKKKINQDTFQHRKKIGDYLGSLKKPA